MIGYAVLACLCAAQEREATLATPVSGFGETRGRYGKNVNILQLHLNYALICHHPLLHVPRPRPTAWRALQQRPRSEERQQRLPCPWARTSYIFDSFGRAETGTTRENEVPSLLDRDSFASSSQPGGSSSFGPRRGGEGSELVPSSPRWIVSGSVPACSAWGVVERGLRCTR